MTGERTVVLMLLAAAVAAAGCRRTEPGGAAKVRSLDEQVREGRASLSDPEVVEPLVSPKAPGRIIYDPPPDLSYASLEMHRPELLRSFDPAAADSARRVGLASPQRDTTGGDAAVLRNRQSRRDTSGASRP